MKKIKYSPDAADKLRALKAQVSAQYGQDKAKQIAKVITDEIKSLALFEKKGPVVADLFEVVTDYRYLLVSRNYVFYRIEEEYIRIVNIYNEREDFMWQLFGIDTTLRETIDYWNE